MKKEKKVIDQDRKDADYTKNKKAQQQLDRAVKKLRNKK